MLYALHLARADAGALGREVFAEVGEHFGMRAGEVAEVASFYSLYNLPPAEAVAPGLHQTCPAACAARAAWCANWKSSSASNPAPRPPTDASRIAEVECLGSCGTAPVVQVNRNPYLELVTPRISRRSYSIRPKPPSARAADSANFATIPEGVDGYLLPPNGAQRLTVDVYREAGG